MGFRLCSFSAPRIPIRDSNKGSQRCAFPYWGIRTQWVVCIVTNSVSITKMRIPIFTKIRILISHKTSQKSALYGVATMSRRLKIIGPLQNKSRTKNWFGLCIFGTYLHRRGVKRQSPICIFGDAKKNKVILNQERVFRYACESACVHVVFKEFHRIFFSYYLFLHVFGYACESACVHVDFKEFHKRRDLHHVYSQTLENASVAPRRISTRYSNRTP